MKNSLTFIKDFETALNSAIDIYEEIDGEPFIDSSKLRKFGGHLFILKDLINKVRKSIEDE
jgi:hypothetical protein